MANYAKEHKLQLDGPVFNIFIFDDLSTIDPSKYMLKASVMIK